jgi:hypothetical protein
VLIILIIVDAKVEFLLVLLSTLSKFPLSTSHLTRYNGGINPESVYPYLAEDTGSCRYDPT